MIKRYELKKKKNKQTKQNRKCHWQLQVYSVASADTCCKWRIQRLKNRGL